MAIPTVRADISKVSIYAARDGRSATQITKEIPLLYTGMWRSPEGRLALFIVNIGDESQPVSFSMDPAEYSLPVHCQACLADETGYETIAQTSEGPLAVSTTIPARSIQVIEFK